MLDDAGDGAGPHADGEDRRRRQAGDAPGQRRPEQAPGVDAVGAERDQQRRHHVHRHSRVEEHRADDDVEGHRHRHEDAEGGSQEQHRAVRRAPVDARDVVQEAPREDLDQHCTEEARQEHQGQRGDQHPPEVADVVDDHPPQRPGRPRGGLPADSVAQVGRAEQRLDPLEDLQARKVRLHRLRPGPSGALGQSRQPGHHHQDEEDAGEDLQDGQVPGEQREDDAQDDDVEGGRADQRRQRRLHPTSALEHPLRDRRGAVHADAQRGADEHPLERPGELSSSGAAHEREDGEHRRRQQEPVGHPLPVGDAPLHRGPADVLQALIRRRLGKESLEPQRRGERLVRIGAGLALQRGVARADPEEPAEDRDDAQGDGNPEIEGTPRLGPLDRHHCLLAGHVTLPREGDGRVPGNCSGLPVTRSPRGLTGARRAVPRLWTAVAHPMDTPAARLPGESMGLSLGVEWSRLASRPRKPVPGHRTLLSSGDWWEGIRVDLVHVTGPLEIHETTLPDHRLVAHLDGPSRTRFWCAEPARPASASRVTSASSRRPRRSRSGAITRAGSWPRSSARGCVDESRATSAFPGDRSSGRCSGRGIPS